MDQDRREPRAYSRDLMSGLGYNRIKRAYRCPIKTVDQVLTVREARESVEGTREVRQRIANCKFTQIQAAKQEILRNQN
jgi:RNase H-fold protein (predicted Holliday junction resolvase)